MTTPECRPVLLVYDWTVIGAEISPEFEDLGFAPVRSFRRPCAALEWVAVHKPLFAVLVLKFSDGPSVAVARELQQRRIPFLFLSGSPSLQPFIRQEFPGAPWVEAPARARQLSEWLPHRDARPH